MKKNIFKIALVLAVLAGSAAKAQDVHFSQFYTTPLHINPAKAGFFNGNFRLAGIYKNQWKSVTTPYSTFSGSADLSLTGKGKKKNDIFGVGFLSTTDKAGDANFTTAQFGVALSYNKKLSHFGNQYLGIGSSFHYSSVHFDYSNLHFDNEFFGKANNEKIVPATGYFDFSTGLEYNFINDESTNFNIGAAVFHINQPKYTFTGNTFDAFLHRKLLLNAGFGFRLNQTFQIYPRILFAQQSSHHEFTTGTFLRIRLDKTLVPKYSIYMGSWYRWKDALILVSRFDIDRLSFAMSYDLNLSTLSKASNGLGGPEFSLLYTGVISNMGKKTTYCPRF